MSTIQTTEITTLKPSQFLAMLTETIPARLPILVSGSPGVAKSACVEQAAVAAGCDLILRHPIVDDPTDYKGMPWVDSKNMKANFLPFGDLEAILSAKKPTVCFIDDLGQASPAVQAAAMQLILARRINGHKVPDFVTFMAATNRRTDRAGVQGILEPVKSRFVSLVELIADVDDWCAWAATDGNIAHELIAFMRFRGQDLLSAFKPTADMTNTPSPRTWENVGRILPLKLDLRIKHAMFEGAVGKAAADEWVAFLSIWQSMVSPDTILTNPDTADIPTEASALYAVCGAIAQRVQQGSMGRYCRYLERLVDDGKEEFAMASFKTAMARDKKLPDAKKLSTSAGYVKAMSGKLGKVLLD